MADLSDVENAMVSAVTTALYPQGVAQASVVGATCRIYRGWPTTAALNSDLAAGTINVTVVPAFKPDEVPEPYFDKVYSAVPATTLFVSVAGQTVTFSGSVASDQLVGLLIDGVPYSCNVNTDDTTDSIAANLTALITADRLAALAGPTITVPGAATIIARVVTHATVSAGLRRQRREIQVCCWCPSATLRDAVCIAADLALTSSPFIALADTTQAHLRYVSTQAYDQSQNALLYRRDLCYKCEYTMISTTSAPVMLFGKLFDNGNSSFA